MAITKTKKEKSASWYLKKADKVFSLWIRNRDNNKCFTCGKQMTKTESQCGHYVSRSCFPLRWNEKNTACQCVGCNIFKKGNLDQFALNLMKKYGDNILYDLDDIKKESKRNVKKYGKDFYKAIIKLYE